MMMYVRLLAYPGQYLRAQGLVLMRKVNMAPRDRHMPVLYLVLQGWAHAYLRHTRDPMLRRCYRSAPTASQIRYGHYCIAPCVNQIWEPMRSNMENREQSSLVVGANVEGC